MGVWDYIILGVILLWFVYCVVLLIRRSRGGHCLSCGQCGVRHQAPSEADRNEGTVCDRCSGKKCRKCKDSK